MSTWWSTAPRDDLGFMVTVPMPPFAITNRAWYVLHRFLVSVGARGTDVLVEKEAFISSRLAIHWGQAITSTDASNWALLGRFNGRAVVADGIVNIQDPRAYDERLELTPLLETPIYMWLLSIGQELSLTTNGYLMSGKPRKRSPMSQSLVKGEKVDLQELATKAGAEAGGLSKIKIGAGWDVRKDQGEEFDLDLVVIGCDANGKAVSDDWRIFFNNKVSPGSVITHSGDNLTGAGEGDDETVSVDLSALPADVVDLRIYVTIYEAAKRGNLNFGQVENAFVRVVDEATGAELSRYDLTEDAGPVQSLELGKVYKHNDAWQFKATVGKYAYELDQVFASH